MSENFQTKFLWLIGIEGSGHHLIRDILKSLIANAKTIDKGPHYPLLLQRWDTEQIPLPQNAVINSLKSIFDTYNAQQISTIYEDTSFPFGDSASEYLHFVSPGTFRGPLRRPDIMDMIQILQKFTNLKILVAYRNPILTVASALRRGFSTKPYFECRLAEAIHLGIVNQLKLIDSSRYKIIHFERLIRNPESHITPLSEWWDIPEDDIRKGIIHIRGAGNLHDIPRKTYTLLEDFFTEERLSQWEPVYSNNLLA